MFTYISRKDVNIYLAYIPEKGYYKIGKTSKHPNERLKQLGYFSDVKLVHYCFCRGGFEKSLHFKFKDKNVKIGNLKEYFSLGKTDVEFIINFMNSHDNEKIRMMYGK
jgi:hypothetical protein